MPNPTCELCGNELEEGEDVSAVSVEKITRPSFRWNEGRIDLDSYHPKDIVFFHLPCWREQQEAVTDLKETLEKQIERAEKDLKNDPEFDENLQGWKEGLEDVLNELENIPTPFAGAGEGE